ncbi:MAG: hypothetical protein AAGJ79_06030, partial [Verrucomicrobiota bacterium]
GIAVHRRGEVGLSAIFPYGAGWSEIAPLQFYRKFHQAIAAVFRKAGMAVELAPAVDHAETGPCWGQPVESDLMLGGEKVCGGALRRTRRGLLYQGMFNVEVADDLAEQVAVQLGEEPSPFLIKRAWVEAAEKLVAEKYKNVEWTRRR